MIRVALTPVQFDAKVVELATSENIHLTGDAGTINSDGYTFTYSYDRPNGVLTFECTSAPIPWGKTLAEHKLHGALIAN